MDRRSLPIRVPGGPIYRIARKPKPWAPPDWSYVGDDGTFGNRFDDSEGYFRVLYASSSRLGCYVETLSRYRTPPQSESLIAAFNAIENTGHERVSFGTVPLTWLRTRTLGEAQSKRTGFADVYCAEWLSYLRERLEPAYRAWHKNADDDFDLGRLLSQERRLTQQIATIAYQLGFDGIFYQSRHGSDLQNWALFEPFELAMAPASPLTPDDADFQRALELLNLRLDSSL